MKTKKIIEIGIIIIANWVIIESFEKLLLILFVIQIKKSFIIINIEIIWLKIVLNDFCVSEALIDLFLGILFFFYAIVNGIVFLW